MSEAREPFALVGVVHLVRPAGQWAHDLDELRSGIAAAGATSLFHHAVQYALRDPACEELPPDDFAAWVGGVVQDRETAERMSFVAQVRNRSADELRAGLLEVLDALPERVRRTRDAPAEGRFGFLEAESVAVPLGHEVKDGTELVDALIAADAGAWFYHLVEEPWFGGGKCPLLEWLGAGGEARLAGWLEAAAAEGLPIDSARRLLARRWRQSRLARRVAEAARAPEETRQEAARAGAAQLARQLARPREAE